MVNIKKFVIPNIPYVLFAYLGGKASQALRLAPGDDFSFRLLHLTEGFSAAFTNPLPSIQPVDILWGIASGMFLWLAVAIRRQNQKKYRHGVEYGSARWSA